MPVFYGEFSGIEEATALVMISQDILGLVHAITILSPKKILKFLSLLYNFLLIRSTSFSTIQGISFLSIKTE